MKFSQFLNEMAKSKSFSSGWKKSGDALNLIKAFKKGEETYEFENGRTFVFKKNVTGNKLEKGQIVIASYNSTNQGAQIYEILGVSDSSTDSDDVDFSSVEKVFAKYDVKSLKDLENEADDISLVVKDLEDGNEGAFFYLYKGRWCRGSGAEPLSFALVEEK